MELETAVLAAFAGWAAHWVADTVKRWLSARKQSTQFEVTGPTGEKQKISMDAAHEIDPVAIKKRILLDMLKDPKYKFRDFERLKAAIAASDQETKDLLLLVGARHNLKSDGKDTWTLDPL